MPQLESSIVASIVRVAKQRGWWIMKIHGGPYQLAGVPDLLLIKNGTAMFFEVKQPGKKATPLQVRRMAEIQQEGGAACHVVTSKGEAVELLEAVA
jgi:Holliday junction resolvase